MIDRIKVAQPQTHLTSTFLGCLTAMSDGDLSSITGDHWVNALRSGGITAVIATVVAVETPDDGPMLLHLEVADGVVVRAADGSIRSIRHDEVLKARTVFTWTREPKSARKGHDRDGSADSGRKVGS